MLLKNVVHAAYVFMFTHIGKKEGCVSTCITTKNDYSFLQLKVRNSEGWTCLKLLIEKKGVWVGFSKMVIKLKFLTLSGLLFERMFAVSVKLNPSKSPV